MIMSVFCVNVSAEEAIELTPEEKSEIKLRNADVDSNGTYSTEDVRLLLQAAAGTGEDKASYDIDSDGCTSVEDALAVLREISNVESLLTDAEAVALMNAKLNNVKTRGTGLPGFEKTITATCNSMKITQTVTASNVFLQPMIKDMNCTDLEYDKYVEKMVDMMGSGKLTESEKQNIEAMKKSAKEYRLPQTEKVIAKPENYVDHFLNFPRDTKNTSSEITTADIASIDYVMEAGNIKFTLMMPSKRYTSFAAYATNTYAKIMNVVEFDNDDGTRLNSVTLNNGSVVMKFNAQTGAMVSADYSYSYVSDVSAPTQTQSNESMGSITVDMKTKTSATITEKVVF